jgi:hypothetical protein
MERDARLGDGCDAARTGHVLSLFRLRVGNTSPKISPDETRGPADYVELAAIGTKDPRVTADLLNRAACPKD